MIGVIKKYAGLFEAKSEVEQSGGIYVLKVRTPDEVLKIIAEIYNKKGTKKQLIKVVDALGRVLYEEIIAEESIPGFNRSTVDGYAVIASDTFGCSESIPAVLTITGEILMGQTARHRLMPGTSVGISTGGDLPEGSDAVVMVEHTESYGEDMVGVLRPAAPGNNIIFKGDDISVGERALKAGTILTAHEIGILSALGYTEVKVCKKPIIGIISTGDELIMPMEKPKRGQIRDVNTPMLIAAMQHFGAQAFNYGIIRDQSEELSEAVCRASNECDAVLISGGASAGLRDMTANVIQSQGEILFHGIAMKPGKPTILGLINSKPVFGLPGHPVAAYFVAQLFVRPLVSGMMGSVSARRTTDAEITEAISSNHGREEYIAVKINNSGTATPIRGKSGLIATLANTDGYICIPRNTEGISAKTQMMITFW